MSDAVVEVRNELGAITPKNRDNAEGEACVETCLILTMMILLR
jgi:hypothetical protein